MGSNIGGEESCPQAVDNPVDIFMNCQSFVLF